MEEAHGGVLLLTKSQAFAGFRFGNTKSKVSHMNEYM